MLPSGTLTFLFTDIEGSTQRWDRDRAAMQNAVRRHDTILREAIEGAGGTIFKTIGDAFCAVFARPQEAVAAILGSQRALAREDFSEVDGLRVRMALHTGTADERDGDYYGPALNRVARLLVIGHGGQMLLSRLTADLVRDTLPSGVTLRELGLHKLKDLAEPEHVHQLVSDDLPHEFPSLRSTGAVPNNLPAETSSFVGRQTELREVAAALEAHRIVSLLGTGGIGKTRLSLQVGAGVIDRFSNGVWFVEFAATSDAALVPGTIASTVGAAEAPGRPALETLVAHLKHQAVLLILDNCEHLIGEIARIADAILRGCPKVKILASSREPLGVSGEAAYRLQTFGIAEAVSLFAARATAANRQFVLTPENEPAVTEICRRLDGIALAIELAAARVNMLSPKALLEKLDDRFRVVAGGSRSALPRQQTLRALVDWSYDLLSKAERTLFRRLAIFAGGFTLELCGSVCADETIDELAVTELLAALVDKSLVHVEIVGDVTRYNLLESIREYAREKLVGAEEAGAFARAHAEAFASFAERLDGELETMTEEAWNARAKPELDNWRAALHWCLVSAGDRVIARRLATALRQVWSRFALVEGLRWVRAALQDGGDSSDLGPLYVTLANLAMNVTQYREALDAARRALEVLPADDVGMRAQAETFVGAAMGPLGESAEGEEYLRRALATFRALNAPRRVAVVLQHLALSRLGSGDVSGALPLLQEALQIFRAIAGAERQAAHLALSLGEAEFQSGDAETALQLAREALSTDRVLSNEDVVAFDLCNIAAYLIHLRRFDEASNAAREALDIASDGEIEFAVLLALQHVAAIASLHVPPGNDSVARAAGILGFVDAQFDHIGFRRYYTEQKEYEAASAAGRQALGDRFDVERNAGMAWTRERAVAEARKVLSPGG